MKEVVRVLVDWLQGYQARAAFRIFKHRHKLLLEGRCLEPDWYVTCVIGFSSETGLQSDFFFSSPEHLLLMVSFCDQAYDMPPLSIISSWFVKSLEAMFLAQTF